MTGSIKSNQINQINRIMKKLNFKRVVKSVILILVCIVLGIFISGAIEGIKEVL